MFLTHEFISLMHGVRRASITDTLRALAEDDLISMKEARSRFWTESGCRRELKRRLRPRKVRKRRSTVLFNPENADSRTFWLRSN
jgi:Mn-dependent DtxR family transcriptional regulator